MSTAGAVRPLGGRILSAYGTSILGVFSGLLTNLWLLRIIVSEIPPREFGVYALVLQITAYLSTLQFGLDFAASRRIAERIGAGDTAGASAAYREVRRFNGRIAPGLAMVVAGAALVLWHGLPGVQQETSSLAARLVLLTGASQVASFLSRADQAALVGSQRQATTNLVTLTVTFGTTLLAYGLFRGGMGVFAMPTAYVCFMTVAIFALAGLARASCDFVRTPAQRNRRVFKELAAFGGLTTLGGVAWTVEATSDVVILGWVSGPVAVAMYALWWRFPSMIFDLSTRLATNAFPGLAERHGKSREQGHLLLEKVGEITSGLAMLGVAGIALWLPSFVRLWVGDRYSDPRGNWIALLMAILVGIRVLAHLFGTGWLAGGDARFTALLAVGQAAVKLGLGIPLGWKLGIPGLLIASVAASAIQLIATAWAVTRRAHDTRLPRVMVPVGLALVVAGVAGLNPVPTDQTVLSFSCGALATAVVGCVVWSAWAWGGPLRPSLELVLRRAGAQAARFR